MRAEAKLKTLKFNVTKYKAILAEYMREKLKDAIRVWLKATVDAVVPTWSGASRATFEKIAREADMAITYGPQKSRKNRKPLGRRESSASFKISNKGVYSFEWSTSLRYFILNNYTRQEYVPGAKDTGSGRVLSPRGLTNPGPYNLDSKGQTALKHFAETIKLPSPFRAAEITNLRS